MSSAPLTTRLPGWLDQAIREYCHEKGVGVSAGMKQIAEEWWIIRNMPGIEIREGVTGPRAALIDGPDIWQIVLARRDYGDDLEGLREHFGNLSAEDIELALAFHELFPERIEARIRENERAMKHLLRTYG